MNLQRYKIEPEHDAGARYYPTPLGRLPSVTTVLDGTSSKRDLQPWFKQVGESEARLRVRLAAERGRSFHHEMETHLTGGSTGSSAYFRSVQRFLSRMDAVALVEGTLWHPDGFAGTVDCVAQVDGVWSVIDWKTTTRQKPNEAISDERLQVAAYRAALQSLYGLVIPQGFLVFALPDEQAHVLPLPDLDALYASFTHRLARFRDRAAMPRPQVD